MRYRELTESNDLARDMWSFLHDPSLHLGLSTATGKWLDIGKGLGRDKKTAVLKFSRLDFIRDVIDALNGKKILARWGISLPETTAERKEAAETALRYLERFDEPHTYELAAWAVRNEPFIEQVKWQGTNAEIVAAIEKAEAEYYANFKRSGIPAQDGDYIVLDLGNGWAWWHLPRAMCAGEGAAMRHCGNDDNAYEDDTLLSLRRQKSKTHWVPKVTAVMSGAGWLGEIRGYANTVPSKRYHPALIALFNHKKDGDWFVQGIVNTGKEDVFYLEQMSADDLQKIKNPLVLDGDDRYLQQHQWFSKIVSDT